MSTKQANFAMLLRLGVPEADAELAFDTLGEDAPLDDIGDFIAQLYLRRALGAAGFREAQGESNS